MQCHGLIKLIGGVIMNKYLYAWHIELIETITRIFVFRSRRFSLVKELAKTIIILLEKTYIAIFSRGKLI